MPSENSSRQTERDACPSGCGDTLYSHTDAPGVQWCDTCEREYWQEGETWFSCDTSGIREKVE